jgi:SAM-dependent methyltransferase
MLPAAKYDLFQRLPSNGRLLDVGCLGFAQVAAAQEAGRLDLLHYGVDYAAAGEQKLPEGFTFAEVDLGTHGLPFQDNLFDAIVASHVMEHVPDPIGLVTECIRVCKPGGVVYLECPSERSLFLPGVSFKHEMFCSFSFYDDPTHTSRPWSPQSLYRLAHYLGCTSRAAGYVTSWKHRLAFPLLLPYFLLTRDVVRLEQLLWLAIGWSAYAVIEKPAALQGKPQFKYFIPSRRKS